MPIKDRVPSNYYCQTEELEKNRHYYGGSKGNDQDHRTDLWWDEHSVVRDETTSHTTKDNEDHQTTIHINKKKTERIKNAAIILSMEKSQFAAPTKG